MAVSCTPDLVAWRHSAVMMATNSYAREDKPLKILAVGFDREYCSRLTKLLPSTLQVLAGEGLEDALLLQREHTFAAICVGEALAAQEARDLIASSLRLPLSRLAKVLVFGVGQQRTIFQGLIDAESLFYVSGAPLTAEDVAALIEGVVAHVTNRSNDAALPEPDGSSRLEVVLEAARRIAIQLDAGSSAQLTAAAASDVVGAARAYCLLYDSSAGTLRCWQPDSVDPREESASTGLVSFVARTGRAVRVDCIEEDPRFERGADDPAGLGGECFLAVPILDRSGRAQAIIAIVSGGDGRPFNNDEQSLLELLADQVASTFSQLRLQARIDQRTRATEAELRAPYLQTFREEAVRHFVQGKPGSGEILKLSSCWEGPLFWALQFCVIVFVGVGLLVKVDSHVSGPAVVHERGAVGSREDRIDGKTGSQLLRPGPSPASQSAQVRRPLVIALLPARTWRFVEVGMPLRFTLDEFSGVEMELAVESVGRETLSPSRARSYLGKEITDALELAGAGVMVQASLPEGSFVIDGRRYSYVDGMLGKVEMTLPLKAVLLFLFRRLKDSGTIEAV